MIHRFICILLAEDNDGDVFLVRRALDKYVGQYQPLLARDGEEALKILERADGDYNVPCPDFAVVDLNLPRFGGIQILERLRKTPRCAGAPVIIFTSSDSPRQGCGFPARRESVLRKAYRSRGVHEAGEIGKRDSAPTRLLAATSCGTTRTA